MNYKLHWHGQAEEDLLRIAHTVTWRFGSAVATRVVSRIVAHAGLLPDNPFLGEECSIRRTDGLKYRVLRSKLNRLVYVIIKDVIYIVAVFDNRQNPSNMENILKERE